MSALTLLIWERWDFSSSRSSSSLCAFFMASMAVRGSTVLAPTTHHPWVGFLSFCSFFKRTKPKLSLQTSCCFTAPSVCAPAAKGLLQIPLFNRVQMIVHFKHCFLDCETPNAEPLNSSVSTFPGALKNSFSVELTII